MTDTTDSTPTCDTCDDDHVMVLDDGAGGIRRVPCTHCPTPCQKCRAGGKGAYCETAPCPCECHRSTDSPTPEEWPPGYTCHKVTHVGHMKWERDQLRSNWHFLREDKCRRNAWVHYRTTREARLAQDLERAHESIRRLTGSLIPDLDRQLAEVRQTQQTASGIGPTKCGAIWWDRALRRATERIAELEADTRYLAELRRLQASHDARMGEAQERADKAEAEVRSYEKRLAFIEGSDGAEGEAWALIQRAEKAEAELVRERELHALTVETAASVQSKMAERMETLRGGMMAVLERFPAPWKWWDDDGVVSDANGWARFNPPEADGRALVEKVNAAAQLCGGPEGSGE